MWSLTAINLKLTRERQDKQFRKYAKTLTLQVADMLYFQIIPTNLGEFNGYQHTGYSNFMENHAKQKALL